MRLLDPAAPFLEIGALAADDRLRIVKSAVATVSDGGGVLLIADIDALLPATPEPVASLILAELRTSFPGQVYDVVVKNTVRLKESPAAEAVGEEPEPTPAAVPTGPATTPAASPRSIESRIVSSIEPRNTEMMVGGASLPPRRRSRRRPTRSSGSSSSPCARTRHRPG